MRRWLLILMVLLLPLRAWVGEAMAAQMVQQQTAAGTPATDRHAHADAHESAAAMVHGHEHAEGAVHECDHGPAHEAAAGDAEQPTTGHGDCPTCASCQICSTVALSAAAWPHGPDRFSHPRPQAVQPSYSSVAPTLAFKPPRS
jgi:hypothetical protein